MPRTPCAHPMHRRTATGGVTLVEAALCLALLSIVAAVALPALGTLIERQRTVSAGHMLLTRLALARMTAITRGAPAVLCPSTDGVRCGDSSDWSGGWLLFLDPDGNRRPDQADDIVRAENAPPRHPLRLVGSSGRKQARYLPDGRSPGSNLTVAICNRKGELLGSIIVNNAGRARSERPARPAPCPG
ncbi:GspH/FimT family pseudopilin [Stenotrophomonas mori]|uniref:Type II secretion system protein H n=1 Tax=Stenotrophomonas mori TaxID=2871096 RepID=A0ABT0SFV1_9GAMM|nr:GspH/FimT family pseudopilin [Stenotrophomonas mori]MCL7714190.1 GspH/FimT family pseudopilin [Stenotrophomonas mori]